MTRSLPELVTRSKMTQTTAQNTVYRSELLALLSVQESRVPLLDSGAWSSPEHHEGSISLSCLISTYVADAVPLFGLPLEIRQL